MLKFNCVPSKNRAAALKLAGAHCLGNDSVPLRGQIAQEGDLIHVDGRSQDPVALSLMWDAPDYGCIQLETTRLPTREKPYLLQLELARHRLMRINLKREEWGLFDYSGMEELAAEIDAARDLFIQALQRQHDEAAATELAEASLLKALRASEQMAQFHAGVFLARRPQMRGASRELLGAAVPGGLPDAKLLGHLDRRFDFVRVPFTWRNIQPKENDTHYDAIDEWVAAAKKAGLAIHGGPLLSFGVRSLPDWMYIWENDYDTVFELARDHVRRSVKRYAKDIKNWVVCSGLHANDALSLNFEHMIELTRMACSVTRRAAPNARVIVDLVQPWGEYFARNQRTVPPLLYAEMVAQSGIQFDAFGLQFLFGVDSEGFRLRDLLQVSSLIDRLANLGKPIHITGVSVPSSGGGGTGGWWREPWNAAGQAEWLKMFCEVAWSRPFVESVCLHSLVDGMGDALPSGGLLSEDLQPKIALQKLVELRERVLGDASAS